ncbi:methylmalonyl-CoA mutase family protein [Nocardioides panacisoli]|uniref:Methylmalonyl-CoA mutase family protein n=1 Tax=Nocardioides panacisoli TaxID=627624 RepID=A0ABP7HYL7_9ACTN
MTAANDATPLALAQPEDQHTQGEWEAATAAVLRKSRRLTDEDADAAVWEKLTRTTLDGIAITPLGVPADLDDLRTAGRPTRAGAWDVRARLAGDDAKLLNEHALVDLDGGVTSLWVEAGPDTDLATLLDGVLLDLAPVVLDSTTPQTSAEALLELADDRGVDLHPDTNFGADPIGQEVRGFRGSAPGGLAPQPADLVAVAELAQAHGVRAVVVDATVVHDLGASDAQELGYSMAAGASYLRALTDAGLGVATAAGLIEFRYAATDEQFPTIAKLRAARRLWARVLELSEVEETVDQRQHAVTSRPMLSKYDPYVNMLRTTVAAFAAGVGGADAVTVLPFDTPLGQPDAFGRRIARNVSHLLMDESHVHEVADPAGGAYAVERLTDDLAVAGWAELDRIEAAGGIEAALADGSLQSRIDEVVARRESDIAKRKRPITGLSEFPNLAETLPERAPATDDVRRYGASFEALRDEPAGAPVFLATLGSIAQHTARATFATNLLAAGGIAVEVAGPTDGVDSLAAAYDGQAVVCLAGTDEAYAEWGADAAAALRERGAKHVIVAGKPADYADDSCAMGVDALAFLNRTREVLR